MSSAYPAEKSSRLQALLEEALAILRRHREKNALIEEFPGKIGSPQERVGERRGRWPAVEPDEDGPSRLKHVRSA